LSSGNVKPVAAVRADAGRSLALGAVLAGVDRVLELLAGDHLRQPIERVAARQACGRDDREENDD
jgi:hypothetical protein